MFPRVCIPERKPCKVTTHVETLRESQAVFSVASAGLLPSCLHIPHLGQVDPPPRPLPVTFICLQDFTGSSPRRLLAEADAHCPRGTSHPFPYPTPLVTLGLLASSCSFCQPSPSPALPGSGLFQFTLTCDFQPSALSQGLALNLPISPLAHRWLIGVLKKIPLCQDSRLLW